MDTPKALGEGVKYLALNIHHEARGEPFECQVSVGEVTLRRVDSPYYPSTIKGVVMQPSQFSWTLAVGVDFSILTPTDIRAAHEAMKGYYYTTEELHYARWDVDNYWTRKMKATMVCGDHVFYSNGGLP